MRYIVYKIKQGLDFVVRIGGKNVLQHRVRDSSDATNGGGLER